MEINMAREVVAETGRILLKHGLVARTWGNVSARTENGKMVITPSGLGYDKMTVDDVVVMDMETGEWEGDRKPSSEKGIHAAAYQAFSEAEFVIHTHQNYATAIGLAGYDTLDITEEEKKRLGGIALAKYGLPGTKKLKKNVEAAFLTGAQVVLMAHHGVVVCGKSREDALEKSILLEEICKRNIKGVPNKNADIIGGAGESAGSTACSDNGVGVVGDKLLAEIRQKYPYSDIVNTVAGLTRSAQNTDIPAQVDDMAQIIGARIIHANEELKDILQKLAATDAVMVAGVGIVVKAQEPDDLEAMKMLVEKAALCNLHTNASGVEARLSWFDTRMMRRVYVTKYSKRK